MSRIESFKRALSEKRAVKIIAGIDNFDINNVKKVILGGKYVHDLVTRMEFAGINMDKVVAKSDLDELMKETKENSIVKIYVITCFSDRMKFLKRR